MKELFDQKVFIITGASSGIGREAAILLARHGAKLVINARSGDKLGHVAHQVGSLGAEVETVVGDVSDDAVARALVERAEARFGGLDGAFNNAGDTGSGGAAIELSPDAWRSSLNANLTSPFLCARHQAPALVRRGGGSIVFSSSFVGHKIGFPGMSAYAAAKAGLVGLTRVMAAELGVDKVRVNALLPGGTDTPMLASGFSTRDEVAFIESLHALKRLAKPEEIAQAALFLLSDAASFVTGTAMLVDGGMSIYKT